MFYDDAGFRLFERITTLPEYYPCRTERQLLEEHAENIVMSACGSARRLRIVELGAGSACKTHILLAAALRQGIEVIYMPLDVSADALETACESIAEAFPPVRVLPQVVNYVSAPPQLSPFIGPTLALYLGSSIGNFKPCESRTILRNLGTQLKADDSFLLGTDLVKEESTLIAAYDDSQGVTAAFNLNILMRLNRELGSNFDVNAFRHSVRWNADESRIEMHLQSIRRQVVEIPLAELELHLDKDETIHTENSYKFDDDALRTLLSQTSFRWELMWKDPQQWYALTLSRKAAYA
jgi:dimethylhistidine N-methyltransferase